MIGEYTNDWLAVNKFDSYTNFLYTYHDSTR